MTESAPQYISVPTSVPSTESSPVADSIPVLEAANDSTETQPQDTTEKSTDSKAPSSPNEEDIELAVLESQPIEAQPTGVSAALPDMPHKQDDTSSAPVSVKDNLSVHGTAPLYEILSPKEQKYVLYSVYCARFLAVLDGTIVAVSLPSILRDLGGEQYLSWVVAAYLLSDSVVLPLSGRLSDIFGRRIVYLGSLALFLIASALCGAATNIWFLIAARLFQGFGGGGLTGMTMIIPGDVVPPKDRPAVFAVIGMIAGIAALLGPIIGGGLTDAYSWRLVFYINLPPGIFSFFLALMSMKRFEVPGKKLELDYLGSILISISTVCLILFITWGGEDTIGYPWSSPVIISLIWGFAFSGVLFIIQEYRHPLPTLQLRLHKIKNVGITYFITFFCYYSMMALINYIAVYFQNVKGDKAIISGLKNGGFVFGFMVTSRLSGKILNKTSKSNIVMGCAGLFLTLGLGLLALITPTLNYGFIFLFTLILGLGIGYIIPAAGAIIQVAVPQRDIAVAMANFSFDSYIGGCVGVTVSGTIFTRAMNAWLKSGHTVDEATAHGVSQVFLWCVPPLALASFLGFFLDPVKKKKTKAEKDALAAQGERESLKTVSTNSTGNLVSTTAPYESQRASKHSDS